jgi:hypothetical protein
MARLEGVRLSAQKHPGLWVSAYLMLVQHLPRAARERRAQRYGKAFQLISRSSCINTLIHQRIGHD